MAEEVLINVNEVCCKLMIECLGVRSSRTSTAGPQTEPPLIGKAGVFVSWRLMSYTLGR